VDEVAGGDLLLPPVVGILRLHKDFLLFDDEVSPGRVKSPGIRGLRVVRRQVDDLLRDSSGCGPTTTRPSV
jgi:hypothetical protein